jgi:hypothetical protein
MDNILNFTDRRAKMFMDDIEIMSEYLREEAIRMSRDNTELIVRLKKLEDTLDE